MLVFIGTGAVVLEMVLMAMPWNHFAFGFGNRGGNPTQSELFQIAHLNQLFRLLCL